MAYSRVNWQNSVATPVNATNLNIMDLGLNDHEGRITTNTTKIGDLILQGIIETSLAEAIKNSKVQLANIRKQPRVRTGEETNDNARLQEFFNSKGNLYLPDFDYVISVPITVSDETDVLVHPSATFTLAANSRCYMFKSNNTLGKGNFRWIGGTINGNAVNQGVEIEPNHDISRAFFLNNFFSIEIGNVKIMDIEGHGIGYWGNEYAYFHDIEIRQGLSGTHPYGGSRRDGISGCARNVIFSNITGFTDDDFIAICPGADWGGSGNPTNVDNAFVRNCNEQRNDTNSTFGAFRGLAVYAASGYKLSNLVVDGVKAVNNCEFAKLTGTIDKISISNINVENDPKTSSNMLGFFWLSGTTIGEMNLINVKGNLLNTTYTKPFIFADQATTVTKLAMSNVNYNNSTTVTDPDSFISLDTNSVINNIINNNVAYSLAANNDFPYLKRTINTADTPVYGATYFGSSGVVDGSFFISSITNRTFSISIKMGYGTANPSGNILLTNISLKKQGSSTNLIDINAITSSSSIGVTNNGNNTLTLAVIDGAHLYPNIPYSVTFEAGATYDLHAEYVKNAGNSELILEPRYVNTETNKSTTNVTIKGNFISKTGVNAAVDIARVNSNDTKFIVECRDLNIDTAALNLANTYVRCKNENFETVEYFSGKLFQYKQHTPTLVSTSTFTMATESRVWRIGNTIHATVLLNGISSSGAISSGDVLFSFDRILTASTFRFASVVTASGTDYNDYFYFEYLADKTNVRAATARTGISTVCLSFSYILY